MAFRTFTDSAGQEWQVYDVVPRPDERRRYDRRSSKVAVPEPVSDMDRDQREDDDRRLTVGRQSPLAGLKEGWLAFESGEDRRRLSPIPEGWETATDAELERYREAAREVRPRVSNTPPAPIVPVAPVAPAEPVAPSATNEPRS